MLSETSSNSGLCPPKMTFCGHWTSECMAISGPARNGRLYGTQQSQANLNGRIRWWADALWR